MISVIIPAYNNYKINKNQNIPKECEIIIETEGYNAAECRNSGVQKAHGDWITFLDGDDSFTEDVEDIVEEIEEYTDNEYMKQILCYTFDKNINQVRPYDNVFVHGKFFKRQWWIDNNIQFANVDTNEEAAVYLTINGLLYTFSQSCIKPLTIVIPKVVYNYSPRKDSITSDPEYNRKAIPDFLQSTVGTLLNRSDIDIEWRKRQCLKAIEICVITDEKSEYTDLINQYRNEVHKCLNY